MAPIDRILFGDNQFFGVNHMSEEKARQQLVRFKNTSAIIEVLDNALDMGIRTFMCTTHDRIGEVCDHMRADKQRYKDFIYFPCMPYAHKYANSVSQVGVIETIQKFSTGGVMSTLFRGAMGAITRDIYSLMKLLVDAEMKRFEGLNTPVIFLQNVVTDLLLGLKLYPMFGEFDRYVKERYGAEAGFITMNLPLLLDALEQAGVENPIVCANINKIGFRMSGGVDAYRERLRLGKCRAIAMSVLASGAIPPKEAIEWACGLEGLHSIVFGASSSGNIRQTRDLIQRSWGSSVAAPVTRAQARPKGRGRMAKKVRLLNVDVDDITMDELLDSFHEGMLLTLHVDMIMKLQKDREFFEILPHFTPVTCDSQILMAGAKMLGTPLRSRVSGSDFFPRYYMKHKDDPKVTVFICGGGPGIAEIAAKNINEKVGRRMIVGTDSPPFDYDKKPGEVERMIERINQSGASVLLVGLGAGRQEKFMVKYRDQLPLVKTFLPLGGTIDYEARTLERPASWVTDAGLEWLYRLVSEPKQRWHRYLVHQPPVLLELAKQRLGLYKNPFAAS